MVSGRKMVDDTGLEPVTSRTSRQGSNFFYLFIVCFNRFYYISNTFLAHFLRRRPCVTRPAVVGYVVNGGFGHLNAVSPRKRIAQKLPCIKQEVHIEV